MDATATSSPIDTRVFLVRAGEATAPRVRKALERSEDRDRTWTLEEVVDVSPMDAAFNEMLRRADLRFHVQVDADMELRPEAIRILRAAMQEAPSDVWQMAFPLWDTLFRRPILGVKIYRSEIARRFPYQAVRHCEVDQIERARQEGLRAESRKATRRDDPDVLGLHMVDDERTAYWNCLDRAMRWKWLEARDAPHNWMRWILPYFHLFLERWVTERDPRFLYAWAGLVSGVSQPIPPDWGEKDIRRPPEGFELLRKAMSLTEDDWRRMSLPPHEREGLNRLARQAAQAVGNPSFVPPWRSPSRLPAPLWRRATRRLALLLGRGVAGREREGSS